MRQPIPSASVIAELPPDGGPEFNRLVFERSPYLLQHARNPVDWRPWGRAAFDLAKKEDKPVFLSVGYSTCHWRHVMERESFENEEVARLINAHFVPVKVDREERPDVDAIYMNATQFLAGGGGWPNSVWLTPDARPWFAGTYFPPEDAGGRAGFKTLLKRLDEIWRTRRMDVEKQANHVASVIRDVGRSEAEGALDRGIVDRALEELRGVYDARLGGFGPAPKFPPHASLRLLFAEHRRSRDEAALEMATGTLDAMARGGLRDHVGGAFHRYSTDERWLLPHFEKMLYDNAQLARAYLDGYAATGREDYRRVAEEIFEWLVREMTAPEGVFYSALDADSEGEEGKFYVWTRAEILEVLGAEDGELFCRVYGVEAEGNFREEATGRRSGANVLHLPRPVDEVAVRERLADLRGKLLAARAKRVRPHLDDKALTAWNGLMIGALAHAARALKTPRYSGAAERAADFILTKMRRDGRLLRSYRDGKAGLNAYLNDYVFLAEGLLDLHDATGRDRWLKEAEALTAVVLEQYQDKPNGGFFMTSADHEELLTRSRSSFDEAVPSGAGVAALVLVRLAAKTGRREPLAVARRTVEASHSFLERAPRGTLTLILAASRLLEASPEPAGAADASSRRRPLSLALFVDRDVVAPGGTFRFALKVSVDDGWHVNAHKPLDAGLVPTTLTVAPEAAVERVETAWPEGRPVQLGFSLKPLAVYEGAVWIRGTGRVDAKAKPGPLEVGFRLRAQSCSDRACLKPEDHDLKLSLRVATDAPETGGRRPRVFGP